jgi:transglutaminase-like putative cysteine protease
MPRLTIQHTTVYRYAKPVTFGEHRLMFRPRDSHDLWLIDTALTITPAATVRWYHDVFGNSIAIASFDQQASELTFVSTIHLEHYPPSGPESAIEPYAQTYPFSYSAEEVPDLGRTMERHYPDPEHLVDTWARQFVKTDGPTDTREMLTGMTTTIQQTFQYRRRDEEGTQTAVETLTSNGGTCRDFALLMMEAARSLGLAARFVTGYLYDEQAVGGGATHAWVQVYLPGAGWVEFDPTNGLVGGKNLVRIAVTRDPTQAIPLAGSFTGAPADFLGMTVDVTVTPEDAAVSDAPPPVQAAAS